MSDTIPTEEEIHVKVILRRWKEFHTRRALLFTPFYVLLGIGMYYVLMTGGTNSIHLAVFIPMLFIAIFYVSDFVTQTIRKRFVKQMTEKESEILVSALDAALTRSERSSLKHLQKVNAKVNPEREYLRFSQQTQDETLLRAATFADTTAQDQLLRPSQTTDE